MMIRERRYGSFHLPLIFSASLVCILIIAGLHGFLTYISYEHLGDAAALQRAIGLIVVWAGVGMSLVSLCAQFFYARRAALSPLGLILANGFVALGWIAIDVYFWYADHGSVSLRHCGVGANTISCQYNPLAVIQYVFMCILTIFTIYPAILGCVKFKQSGTKGANAQEVQVLLQEATASTASTASTLPLISMKPGSMTSNELHETTIPQHLSLVSNGLSMELSQDYTKAEMPATDPFDSNLQKLDLLGYSVFSTPSNSPSNCVVATIAFLLGYSRATDLYKKLHSMRNPAGEDGLGGGTGRQDLYKWGIYYLLKQLTDDKIYIKIREKAHVLRCLGTSIPPLSADKDWNMNQLAVVYNTARGEGECIVLDKNNRGIWDVLERQVEEVHSAMSVGAVRGGTVEDFRFNAAHSVLVFAICAGEHPARSAMSHEARMKFDSNRTTSLTKSISTVGVANRAASPVITDISLAPSYTTTQLPPPTTPLPPPTSPFRTAHPRFSAHFPSPDLTDDYLAVLYSFDRSRATALHAEIQGLRADFDTAAKHDTLRASQYRNWPGIAEGVRVVESMSGIAVRLVEGLERQKGEFRHLEPVDADAGEDVEVEIERWRSMAERVRMEVARRSEMLEHLQHQEQEQEQERETAYQRQNTQSQQPFLQPPERTRHRVTSRFTEVDLGGQPQAQNRLELAHQTTIVGARAPPFKTRVGGAGGRREYERVRQDEAELEQQQQQQQQQQGLGLGLRPRGREFEVISE